LCNTAVLEQPNRIIGALAIVSPDFRYEYRGQALLLAVANTRRERRVAFANHLSVSPILSSRVAILLQRTNAQRARGYLRCADDPIDGSDLFYRAFATDRYPPPPSIKDNSNDIDSDRLHASRLNKCRGTARNIVASPARVAG